MAGFGDIVLKGVQTTLTYISVLLCGAFLSQWPEGSPLLDEAMAGKLGKIIMLVLMPAMMITTLGEL